MPRSICSMFVALETSQPEMSWLKLTHSSNTPIMFVTAETSQPPTSSLNPASVMQMG